MGHIFFKEAIFEGLIFGGAYIRRGLSRGDLTEGFLRYRFGGLIFSEFYGSLVRHSFLSRHATTKF